MGDSKRRLGAADALATINVSDLSVYSSLLAPNELVKNFDARAATVRQEQIQIRRLDSVWGELHGFGREFYLKVDTQGFEPEVIRGADSSLKSIRAVQLELSFLAHYEGELLLAEMIEFMSSRGFELRFVKPVQYDPRDFFDPTARLRLLSSRCCVAARCPRTADLERKFQPHLPNYGKSAHFGS